MYIYTVLHHHTKYGLLLSLMCRLMMSHHLQLYAHLFPVHFVQIIHKSFIFIQKDKIFRHTHTHCDDHIMYKIHRSES